MRLPLRRRVSTRCRITHPTSAATTEGPSDFDHANVFVTSYVYQAPDFTKRNSFVRYGLGGWELSGIMSAQSGRPITIYAGQDQSKTAIGSDRAQFAGGPAYKTGTCSTTAPCKSWLKCKPLLIAGRWNLRKCREGPVPCTGILRLGHGGFSQFPGEGAVHDPVPG